MGLGTRNRQKQTAEFFLQKHLREKYRDKPVQVEEFIVEIEGPSRKLRPDSLEPVL